MTTGPTRRANLRGRQQWQELIILLLLIYNTFIGSVTFRLSIFYLGLITWILYFGIIGLWLINLLRQKRPFPQSPLDLPFILLSGIILGATIFSIEPRLSLDDIPLYFFYIMLYYMVIDRLRAGWQIKTFLKALIMTTTVVCMVAGLEYLAWYIGLPVFPAFKQGWWSIGGWQNPIPPRLYRLSFTLINANFLASLLASTLPIGVAVAMSTRSCLTRINAIIWVLLNFVVLLFTFSRGGLLSAIAGLLILATFMLVKRRDYTLQSMKQLIHNRQLILFICVGALAIVMLLLIFPVTELLSNPSGVQFRLVVWDYALQMIWDHPLIGVGPHTFGAAITNYWNSSQFPFSIDSASAHNAFLHMGTEIGLPGALVILVIALLTIRAGYRQVTRLPSRQTTLMMGVLSGLMAFGIHNIVDNFVVVPAVTLPVIVMAAICSTEFGADLSPVHSLLTPKRGLLLTVIVAIWVAWSVYGLIQFSEIISNARSQQWLSATKRLDELPVGILPHTFYQFQRGLAYGKLALDNSEDDTIKMAIADYRDGLATMPRYLPGHANLSALYWQSGDLTNAQHELQTAISSADKSGDEILYRLNLGLLFEQQGDDEAAIAAYAPVLALSPSFAESIYWQETDWRRRHWDLILSKAETQIEQTYEPEVANIRKGELAYFSGHLQRAEDLFRLSMADTDSHTAYIWLSRILIDQGRFQEAVTILDNILEMPKNRLLSEAYLNRGRANLALGQDDEAVRDLKTALFLGNNHAQYYMGRLALSKGDVKSAISLYRQSLSLPHNLFEVNRGHNIIIYGQVGIDDNNLLPLAVLPPSSSVAEVHLELADLYISQGNIEAAQEICQQLLDLSPGYQPVKNKLETIKQ
ncbi:O-antigen ligase family protein [Chloroflexota bacterium]